MAAPTPTARVTPDGTKLKNGYRTLITFATDPNIALWEKGVTPPGFDGGDAVDNTTMWNDELRTFSPASLSTMTESSGRCAYDPAVYDQIMALLNVETTITVTFPDGSTLAFYGYLRVFEPGELQDGEQPEANFTIQPTNADPTTGDEELPVYGT